LQKHFGVLKDHDALGKVASITALLAGSAFLFFAGGVNGLILPVRGNLEGFSAASLGLLGTGWAAGYVLGCLKIPPIVARAGHIRAFALVCSAAAVSVLLSLLILSPWAWIPLRGLSGFCFAGAAMIVESWLTDQTSATKRGYVFGTYTTINLGANTTGQLILMLGDPSGYFFFVLAAIVYCLALMPTAARATVMPQPIVKVGLDLKMLWRNSPVAVFAVLMVGTSNAAFGTLAAVYAARANLALTEITLFAALPALAGAISQIPIGRLSDKYDRRRVLVAVAAVGLTVDLIFVLTAPTSVLANLILAFAFGASVFAMYPIIIAHANDQAEPGNSILVSGGLLLVFGIGSIVGPTIAGLAMTSFGITSLFVVTATAHTLIIAFAVLRLRVSSPVPTTDKTKFVATPSARTTTPQTAVLAKRETE
jgi:MFS family permease